MTDSLTGGFACPIIDGYLLDGASIVEEDFTQRKLKEVVTLQPSGAAREAIRWQGAGLPMLGLKHDLTLRYSHLRSHYDLVEELMNAPGPHDIVIWKRVHLVYAGDGSTDTFSLPWLSALDFYNIPGPLESASARLAVEVRTGLGGRDANGNTVSSTEFEPVAKDDAGYDTGDPEADEVWFLEEGQEFRLLTPPLAGTRLYVRMVPILQMYEGAIVTKNYPPASRREPRNLQLMER